MSPTFNNSFITNGLNVEKAYRPPQNMARDCSLNEPSHNDIPSHNAKLVTDRTKMVSDAWWNYPNHLAMNRNHRTERFATSTYKKKYFACNRLQV